jgi:hypothetical protein
LGFVAGHWRQIRGYVISKRLQRTPTSHAPPPSRFPKAFAPTPKRKPRVNDDQKAWLAEKERR